MKNEKLKRFVLSIQKDVIKGLKEVSKIILVFFCFSFFCFLLGLPFVSMGWDLTRDNIFWFEKCLGMGMIALVFAIISIGVIAGIVKIVKYFKNLWENS